MNLMLAVMFLCIGIGLRARTFGAREQASIVAIAVVMTAMYFFFRRFM